MPSNATAKGDRASAILLRNLSAGSQSWTLKRIVAVDLAEYFVLLRAMYHLGRVGTDQLETGRWCGSKTLKLC